jgi:hypothetical protein
MGKLKDLSVGLCLVIWLGGCDLIAPVAPPDNVLTQGMSEALLDTGFYREVSITRTLGMHFSPADKDWRVFACFQFVLNGGQQGSTCVDSFQALALDNGTWVVSVTIDGVYRWRAITTMGESQGAPAVNVPPAP